MMWYELLESLNRRVIYFDFLKNIFLVGCFENWLWEISVESRNRKINEDIILGV